MDHRPHAKAYGRVLILLLVIALAVMPALSGCGKKSGGSEDQTTTTTQATTTTQTTTQAPQADYQFRKYSMLKDHYYKHGIDMGFDSPEEYLAAANRVIANPNALTKKEKEDGDTVFYVEDTNEFVVLSRDGYIRTYFLPDSGKRYFDRQ